MDFTIQLGEQANVFYGLTDGKISTISANVLSVEKLE